MGARFSGARRRFLQSSATGAAGLAVSAAMPKKAFAGASQPWPAINPDIDNLRVVSCRDPNMVSADWEDIINFADMDAQNDPANRDLIRANMDEMAKVLAQKSDAGDAWATIFQKPGGADWSAKKAAIKVNCIAKNHPRLALVEKVCDELNALGIPYESIFLFDGCSNAYHLYDGYVGDKLPAGAQVSDRNSLLGGTERADIPAPYTECTSAQCTAHIADGTIDILVNMAVNKGHSIGGKTTLTMKNHFGTFDPHPPDGAQGDPHGNLDYVLSINKSDAILGGAPPRQRLCIIDSLWGMVHGPSGTPNKNTYRIVMGTFGPAVDYFTVKKIREPEMAATHDAADVARFL
ncbi:MAG: DUF362 domain-containing protein, partial [Chitinivibrionales bacterium]|nr:DUF362 domain-containing protein [Chitinivibrionales bacterium]